MYPYFVTPHYKGHKMKKSGTLKIFLRLKPKTCVNLNAEQWLWLSSYFKALVLQKTIVTTILFIAQKLYLRQPFNWNDIHTRFRPPSSIGASQKYLKGVHSFVFLRPF